MARTQATRRTRRTLALGLVAAAAFGLATPVANAATTASIPCAARTTAQKFAAIDGDTNLYFTAPSGTFESGTSGWVLNNATVASGNESHHINGTGDSKSLKIGSGGNAITPIFCNQTGERYVRFFYMGTPGAHVHLFINVTNSSTNNRSTLDWEVAVPSSGWGVVNGVNTPDLYSLGYENLQMTFSAISGTVYVDDVEIDPFKPL